MGGDFGPRSIVQACIASLSATPSLHLTLVGQPSLLEELIASHPAVDRARLTITPASETITMDESRRQPCVASLTLQCGWRLNCCVMARCKPVSVPATLGP